VSPAMAMGEPLGWPGIPWWAAQCRVCVLERDQVFGDQTRKGGVILGDDHALAVAHREVELVDALGEHTRAGLVHRTVTQRSSKRPESLLESVTGVRSTSCPGRAKDPISRAIGTRCRSPG